MTTARLRRLTLTDFRGYVRAELALEGGSVFLFGPNGAGKTNLLEAISLLSPGRGLRGASIADLGRRAPDEAIGRAWAVAAAIEGDDGVVSVGTGVETAGAARRLVRLEGEPVPPGRLSDILRLVWLTPREDRLFLDAASDRRRFFDRLVFAAEPAHGARVTAYERAMRERMRLLIDGPADADWLTALEAQLGEAGAAMATARARSLVALQAWIDSGAERAFPRADLGLTGAFEQMALSGLEEPEIATRLAVALASSRDRDALAGRALTGPHRGDLSVRHRLQNRAAADCSTGEQKALILNLVLAQAARLSARLSGANSTPNPIVLLDEVAAHLDPLRRAALFDEIEALDLQAFLTGADGALFDGLHGRAQGVRVDSGELS